MPSAEEIKKLEDAIRSMEDLKVQGLLVHWQQAKARH